MSKTKNYFYNPKTDEKRNFGHERVISLEEGVHLKPDGTAYYIDTTELKYYAVLCKGGHTKNSNSFMPILTPQKAASAKAAAQLVRYKGRIKHDSKNAIIFVAEITREQYETLKRIDKKDPYINPTLKRERDVFGNTLASRELKESWEIKEYTSTTDLRGSNFPLQNYIIENPPYSKATINKVVDEYIAIALTNIEKIEEYRRNNPEEYEIVK